MFHIAAWVSAFLVEPNTVTVSPLSRDKRSDVRCQDTGDEFHGLFARVDARLRCVDRTLRGCGRYNLRTSVWVLVLFRRLVARFQRAVAKHRELNLLVRFATQRSTLDKLKGLHQVVDRLFGYVELQSHPQMTEWRDRWAQDCVRMYATFEARVKQPQLAVAGLPTAEIAEILAIMKYELDYHKDKLTHQQVGLLQRTANKVVASSKVHVPKISAFYIPSVDVEFGDDCEGVWDTRGCEVKRGVYDQETRLVAQYLSADNRYARQLFWSVTEIWHGFRHPNVAKMLGESLVEAKPVVVWEDAAANGNFIHYFANEEKSNQRRLWRMFLQVAHGLNYIHQQGKAHGNLKCSHIGVAKDGTPKICHFELSKGSDVGALDRWKGPEYNLGIGLDPSTAGDVYAFGLCIIEARTGDIPYGLDCDETVKQQLEECGCYPRPEGLRDDEWNVVERFVVHNPGNRPTMAQAIEMVEELAWNEALEEEKTGFDRVNTAQHSRTEVTSS